MIRKIRTIITTIILLVLVISTISITKPYVSGDTGSDTAGDDNTTMAAFSDKQVEYKELRAQNEDFTGWLYVDGTMVDEPLMQTKDEPDYYLEKDFEGEYSKAGLLFISNISDIDKPSDVVIIFGHNMANGTRFGTLRKFEDSDFTGEHGNMWVDSLDKRREYEVTHVMRIRVGVEGQEDAFPYYGYSDFTDENEFDEFIKQCNEYSLYDTGKTTEYGDRFLILSTCEYTWDDGSGRLVVMGKELIDEPEEVEVTGSAAAGSAGKSDSGTVSPTLVIIIVASLLALTILVIAVIRLRRKMQTMD